MQTEEKAKESFVMYGSFLDAAEKAMTLEQIGQYVLLLRDYALKGEEVHSDNPLVEAFLIMAKPNIRAASERYKQSCKGREGGNKGAKYGDLGGRPRKGETKEEYATRKQLEYERKQREKRENETGENPKSPVETPENPNKPPKNPLNDNVNVKEKEKIKDNIKGKEYVYDYEKEKNTYDFMNSLILDDFDDNDNTNDTFYEKGSVGEYMYNQRLKEMENMENMRIDIDNIEDNDVYTYL